jgi:catechol 2,3-dioxygenase-like lactoylglutathione lyase family enzyme
MDLNVSDLERSAAFYRDLLGRWGYTLVDSGPTWRSFGLGSFYLCLVQAQSPFVERGYHRKGVGLNHLAFHAPSRAAVDDLYRWLLAHRVQVLYGGPMEMGTAAEPNYAVFFEDPDRVKLEYVYRPFRPFAGA